MRRICLILVHVTTGFSLCPCIITDARILLDNAGNGGDGGSGSALGTENQGHANGDGGHTNNAKGGAGGRGGSVNGAHGALVNIFSRKHNSEVPFLYTERWTPIDNAGNGGNGGNGSSGAYSGRWH